MLEELRRELHQLHLELPKQNLVVWTSGNISARDPKSNWVLIKPSGVKYERLTPENMVLVDLEGKVLEGSLKPSVDCESHLVIYRARPDVMGIVHTHSPYATAFAALGRSIPVVLTAIADEFGGPIPCGDYAAIGGEEVGKEVLRAIGKSPAVLLKHHGVFTIGSTVEAAVKSAVMTEEVAKTVFFAQLLGNPTEIPSDEVLRGHRRYKEAYGQHLLPH